jgi:hypothetical protein
MNIKNWGFIDKSSNLQRGLALELSSVGLVNPHLHIAFEACAKTANRSSAQLTVKIKSH